MKRRSTIQGFKALELKSSEDAKSPHYIYYKEHSVREQSEVKPSGRTLFAVNVPPYIDSEGIKRAFADAGTVTSVIFHNKPSTAEIVDVETKTYFSRKEIPTFRIAYIVFDKVSELDNALKLNSLNPAYTIENKPKFGISKWAEEYNSAVPFTKALKKEIDDFMKQHDEKIVNAEEKERELEQEDDDGWVKVTRKGNVSSFARSEKVESKIMQKEALGKKRKELKNFYSFQIRESKMKHLVALRLKFEEDKKKIAQIKQSRRFKPF